MILSPKIPLESTAGTAGPNLQEAITQLVLTFYIAHYERKSSAAPPECKIFNQNAKRPPDGREIPEKPFFFWTKTSAPVPPVPPVAPTKLRIELQESILIFEQGNIEQKHSPSTHKASLKSAKPPEKIRGGAPPPPSMTGEKYILC